MYIVDGIAYACELVPGIAVKSVRAVGNHCMVVTFSTGETRLFDVTELLALPAFAPLEDEAVFADAVIDRGINAQLA